MTDNRNSIIQRVTIVGVVVNILLSIAQIVSGLLAHSQALVADGLHTLADLFSDFIVLLTNHHAAKEADDDHPYGHGRIETLSSIFLGVALIGTAIGIGFRGIESIINPSQTPVENYALAFAVLAILSKEFLYRYTIINARKIKSVLLESNAMHHRSDVFSSVIVLIGIGAQLAGIAYMDAVAALIVSIMISLMGLHLVRKAFAELIDTSLDQELVDKVKNQILANDGVVAVHSLRSRSMGGMGFIDTEIRVNPRLSVSEAHYISLSIEKSVRKNFSEISDITVHIDPVAETDHDTLLELPKRSELLFNLYSAWESLEDSANIKNIHLHYLESQVEVDIILPLAYGCNPHNQLAENLLKRASDIHHIGQINIYYAP